MENCLSVVLVAIGIAVIALLAMTYRYILELEAIAAVRADSQDQIFALRVQRDLQKIQIARLEIEVESLKAKSISE